MGLTYRWQVSTDSTGSVFNDIPANSLLVDGLGTSTITLRNLTTANNNLKYRVIVGSTDYTIPPVVSSAATLFSAPTITFSNIPDTITSSNSATFFVSGVTNTGVLSYQWQKRVTCSAGVPEPCFINLQNQAGFVSGVNSNTLYLTGLDASIDNNTQYRVIGTSQCCGTSPITKTSNIATLQVSLPGQTLVISSNPSDAIISTNGSATFNITIQTTTTNSQPVPVVFTWQKLVGSLWTTVPNTSPIQSSVINSSLLAYSQSLLVNAAVDGDQYRVLVSDGRSSITSIIVRSLTSSSCIGCGGTGHGDPHYYMNGSKGFVYGFDDNPIINGHKEIIMLYIRNNKDNTEHILSCKNAGSFGSLSPYNIERVTYTKKIGNKILQRVDNGKVDMMGVVSSNFSTATGGTFSFDWSILNPQNINKTTNLDITIGGAWYWMSKSLIQYIRKNPKFLGLGWPWIGLIHADGISIGLAPYGLGRKDFEIDNLVISGGSSNINGLYIAYSRDNKNYTNYNRDNSAYSIIKNNNKWQIKTRQLSNISATILSSTKLRISYSGYLDGESLSVGLGVGAVIPSAITGNPRISNIIINNLALGQKLEDLVAEITVDGGSFVGSVGSSVNVFFGYFVNTTLGSNQITPPDNFKPEDFYIGQKITISNILPTDTTITSIDGNVITLSNNCNKTGRFPLEILYCESSNDNASSPDLCKTWFKNTEILDLSISNAVYTAEGLSKITENIKDNPLFWEDLSRVLNGKPLLDKIVIQNDIVAHPQDTVSVNGTARFTVVTKLPNNSKYQWQKSIDSGTTWNNINGAISATLVLQPSKKDNNTLYRVIVDNGIFSKSAKLTVPSSLSIQQEPADQSALNLEAVFSVVASGTQPIVYTWEKSDDNGRNYIPISGGNLSSLVLTNLTSQDDGDYYRVGIQDGAGDAYLSSGKRLSIDPVVTITSHPTNQISSESETATFSVSGICNNGGLKYQWEMSTNNGISYSLYGDLSTTGILNLSGLRLSDNKKIFRAKLISDIKNNFVYSSGAMLTVPNPIVISQQPSNTVAVSGSASFAVVATSTNPPLSYQWQKSSSIAGNYTDIDGATGSTLNLTNLTILDDNTYYKARLVDNDKFVEISQPAYLDIVPQITIIDNISNLSDDPYTINLSINAVATDGTLKYIWEKSNPNSNIFIKIAETSSGNFIASVIPSDSGSSYRVRLQVDGARDVISNIILINVPQTLQVNKLLPISRKINYPNKDIELAVDVTTKRPPISYQWQVADPSVETITYQLAKNDIFYDNVQVLLEMEGQENSKVFIDSSLNKIPIGIYRNNDLFMSADIKITTQDSKIGTSSAKFNDKNSHIRILDNNDYLTLGKQNFTIEYWYKPTLYGDMAGVSRRFNRSWPDYGDNGWVISSTKFRAKIGSMWRDDWIDDTVNLDNIAINEWHHIALSRHNNIYRMFRDGILIGTFINNENLDESAPYVCLGVSSSTTLNSTETDYSLRGYLDSFKITKGIAKYIDNFVPDMPIENRYNLKYSSRDYKNIEGETNSSIQLQSLTSQNNIQKYRVIVTDAVSSIIIEEQ